MKFMLLVVGVLTTPVFSSFGICDAVASTFRLQKMPALCIPAGTPTEAEFVKSKGTLVEMRVRTKQITAARKLNNWCDTVALNGSYPGPVFNYADVADDWPAGRKPTVAECLPRFENHYLGLTAADLKRGYGD